MKLTRERALELHRQMWSDMQKDLGDNAYGVDRIIYKEEWCQEHFPNEHIKNDCFLCEYAKIKEYITNCNKCPIRWTTEDNDDAVTTYCCYDDYYYHAPISEILALPERELRKENQIMLDITRENALKLHRQMWSDMQRDLGDCPSLNDRLKYKEQWCREHFGNIFIVNDCFLCEYVESIDPEAICEDTCPIKWTDGGCMSDNPANNYETMPISKLLALPEREFDEVN